MSNSINFHIVQNGIPISGNLDAYLLEDGWNDWFTYRTLYYLVVFDEQGKKHDIGNVKIGQVGLRRGRPDLPSAFTSLDDTFFSLGQSDGYYQNIHNLHLELRSAIVKGLKDIVNDKELYTRVFNEDVLRTSLLRFVSPLSVRGRFESLLEGHSELTNYHFEYNIEQSSRIAGFRIDFKVEPNSNPPTNIHVIIGRNGVGKTHLLNNMVKALVDDDEDTENLVGSFSNLTNDINRTGLFAGGISVSFSAFDPFDPLTEKETLKKGVRYSYVGLKRETNKGGKKGTPKSREMLINDFSMSLKTCVTLKKYDQWIKAVKMLETDPLFAEIGLRDRLRGLEGDALENEARLTFKRMSSGHSIVLLTITKLIEKVEEKTLVLIDEPESHLHPPLLSAFTRTLSEIISHRNGVALIATHSPVILQEVPKSCVWKLRRVGNKATVTRPEIETFGENTSVLTNEIFGLEVTKSGYHQLLDKAIEESDSYECILSEFNNQLGSEARGIARGLMAIKNQSD